jgi:hypothetical protein
MDRRCGVGLIIFLLFLLLVIVVIFLMIFLNGRDEPKLIDVINVTVNKTYFNVTLSSNAVSKISYVLSNDSHILLKGSMFSDVEERFYNVENSTNITLEGFSDAYYYNFTKCNVTRNMQKCKVNLKAKSLNYSVVLTNESVTIDPQGKVVQSPILLCFSWGESISNVILDLEQVSVPSDYVKLLDLCYKYDEDISSSVVFPLMIHRNEFYNSSELKLLKVSVFDFEKSPYSSIGLKESGVLVYGLESFI